MMFQMHWPVSFKKPAKPRERFPINPETGATHVVEVPVEDTWKAMEALVEKGKVRSIGVSNFTSERIEKLLKTAKIKPAVNQVSTQGFQSKEAVR